MSSGLPSTHARTQSARQQLCTTRDLHHLKKAESLERAAGLAGASPVYASPRQRGREAKATQEAPVSYSASDLDCMGFTREVSALRAGRAAVGLEAHEAMDPC